MDGYELFDIPRKPPPFFPIPVTLLVNRTYKPRQRGAIFEKRIPNYLHGVLHDEFIRKFFVISLNNAFSRTSILSITDLLARIFREMPLLKKGGIEKKKRKGREQEKSAFRELKAKWNFAGWIGGARDKVGNGYRSEAMFL